MTSRDAPGALSVRSLALLLSLDLNEGTPLMHRYTASISRLSVLLIAALLIACGGDDEAVSPQDSSASETSGHDASEEVNVPSPDALGPEADGVESSADAEPPPLGDITTEDTEGPGDDGEATLSDTSEQADTATGVDTESSDAGPTEDAGGAPSDTDTATSGPDISAEDTSAEDTSAGDASSEDASAEDTSAEDTSAEDTSAEDTSAEYTSADDTEDGGPTSPICGDGVRSGDEACDGEDLGEATAKALASPSAIELRKACEPSRRATPARPARLGAAETATAMPRPTWRPAAMTEATAAHRPV